MESTINDNQCQKLTCAEGTSPSTLGQCGGSCSTGGSFCLDDALHRFEKEATRGTHDTGRYICSYYVWGSGPPLLFVHGLGDIAKGFVPAISMLAAHFRCIAYDLPTGRGDRARLNRYSHSDLVADVFSLLDHLSAPQAYVLGTSLGGTIALGAMRAQPERIPRAILVGSFARRALARREVLLVRLASFWPGSIRHLPFREPFHKAAYGPRSDDRNGLWNFYFENTGVPPIRALARRALIVNSLDLRSILSEIHQPVLMICGDRDVVVNQACEDVLLRGLPNAARVELVDSGHMSHYSHAPAIAELVRHFLTPPPGTAPRANSDVDTQMRNSTH
jgi:pimeloyl-ACP methyl ester carboxylesterase